jgi:hypothetical protein
MASQIHFRFNRLGWGAQIDEKSNARLAQILAQREQQQLLSNKEIVASVQITAAL